MRRQSSSKDNGPSPPAQAVRLCYHSVRSNESDTSGPYAVRTAEPGVAANTLICLVNQASYLIVRQLRSLEQALLATGGITERLYRERKSRRDGRKA